MCIYSDRARHFSNQSDIYKVVKVVHGNQSDNHHNQLHGHLYYYYYYCIALFLEPVKQNNSQYV